MRRMLSRFTLIVVLLLVPLVVFATAPTYRLEVAGLSCPFCAYGIEKKLMNTEGVEKVEIDINEGVVIVTMREDARLDEEQAKQIVKDAGFTLEGFNVIEPE